MAFLLRLLDALWHVVGILLLLVLFLEFGIDALRRLSRRLRHGRGRLPDRAATADANREADWAVGYFDEFSRGVRIGWRSYVGWWQLPYRGAHLTLDEHGLRSTPGGTAVGSGAIRIFCFGGSTMMGMGARDEHTIPAILARRLGELGHPVSVTNFGQLGHNSTQEAISLHQLLKQGERPDIALFYDGINEMAGAEQTGRADALFNESRRRAEFNLLHPERRRELIAAAAMALVPRTLRRLRRLTGLPLRGPLPEGDADLSQVDVAALAAAVVASYAANLRLVRVLGRDHGFRPLFFWQPVITTKRVKSPDEQRFEADYTTDPAARRQLYGAILAARRHQPELAAAGDAIDLAAIFDEIAEPVYIDLYHLSELGNGAVAEAMLPALAPAVAAARRSAA
jgi:lysophospholipase L1-like esterase